MTFSSRAFVATCLLAFAAGAMFAPTDPVRGGSTTLAGDVDGDRASDLVSVGQEVRTADGVVLVAPSRDGRFGPPQVWHAGFAARGADRTAIGDFDGDGRKDLVTWQGGGSSDLHVARSEGDRLGRRTSWGQVIAHDDETLFATDFDGDGKDDILLFSETRGRARLARSTGTSFQPTQNLGRPFGRRQWRFDGGRPAANSAYLLFFCAAASALAWTTRGR